MRTSVTQDELRIIARALYHHGHRTPEERGENVRSEAILALAQHIEIIGAAAAINSGETIIEVKP